MQAILYLQMTATMTGTITHFNHDLMPFSGCFGAFGLRENLFSASQPGTATYRNAYRLHWMVNFERALYPPDCEGDELISLKITEGTVYKRRCT
jgi:hypothetical protein